ncbi:recombinase family protein [Alterisphingorhabdus coralli]|uniref:Recombinase family protein n=1 Tax=Alterisphingorhabdus coralli TaxID=3071408 RepID=A0AA97FBB8_9SPHN|nr:recombinase family protein [Parasphingorhabdus sp. SCSIO 66989]WOE76717.1 recombinase family protein [Parasphingorhabdus sp. SCSIO 66989]
MKIGYARVSTDEQNLDGQVRELENAGCEKIFTDHGISGKAVYRPALQEAVAFAREGDIIVVQRLDRLCRNLKQLIDELDDFGERNIGFASLREEIDTSTAPGRLYFHIIGALAQFERELISDRTKAGLEAARAKNTQLGRPRKLDDDRWREALALIRPSDPKIPPLKVAQVAKLMHVSKQTLYNRLNELDGKTRKPSPT